MNETLLLQRREAELQSQMHENSKTSHYSKLGSAFFSDTKGSGKTKMSPRGSVNKS